MWSWWRSAAAFRPSPGRWSPCSQRDADEITARFGAVFRTVTSAVQAYLDEMSRTFGGVPEDPSKGFDWAAERGRDHYYMQVTQDLIDKIGTGEYAAGTFLPTEVALSDTYGVCIATVRKALSMLNELGFGQTVRPKGPGSSSRTIRRRCGC